MCSHICYCKLVNFSFSMLRSVRFRVDTVLPRFLRYECISLPGECIVLDVGALLETRGGGARGIAFTPRIVHRDAAYRYAEDKQMIRGRIKCARGVFSGVHCRPWSVGVNGRKKRGARRPDGRLAFRRVPVDRYVSAKRKREVEGKGGGGNAADFPVENETRQPDHELFIPHRVHSLALHPRNASDAHSSTMLRW